MIEELPVDKLRRVCDPELMGCSDSSQISSLKTIIGQERAVRALQFGLGIKEKGFNIYVAGMPGTGRITSIERFLEETAAKEPAPSDWCYVHNFHDSYRPRFLQLPAGQAAKFQADMERLATSAVKNIRSAFESEDYATQREEAVKSFQTQKQDLIQKISEEARKQDFAIRETPVGLVPVPLWQGKPISEEDFMALGDAEREIISQTQKKLVDELEAAIRQAKGLDKSASEKLQSLDQEVGLYAIKHLVADIKEKYPNLEQVQAYLDHVQQDILENLADFKPEGEEQQALPAPFQRPKPSPLKKYAVNVLVNNAEHQAAPVILERNPTYANLFGRIEQEAEFGALTTNFTLIRPGSLHRANGGYLVIPVVEMITSPLSWESLKRALGNKELVIEDVSEKLGMISTKSLRPEPIPLAVKVILVGRPDVYQALLAYDEHFNELFKVKADFDTQMPRSPENVNDYEALISKICEDEHLKHLDNAAMARIVEHGSRKAEDQEKLSTQFGEMADVIREASYYASLDAAPLVTLSHIRKAIDERFYRSGQVQERIREMIVRGLIKIDVDGEKCGQVNGLSVVSLGDVAFGQPSRITASIGLGREGLLDIEREANLGGPLHTKGVLILSGYLAEKYAQDKPLSLTARLVFEQSYSGVDGDSASSTELYAILSALSGLPIRQGIAVTGSVNQMGEVQAIGGVNEKIEGFFAVCQAMGLTGRQGVMIPASNVCNLMLKDEVVAAVQQGHFHVWAVTCIDEGIEVLTGVQAGQRLESGSFPEDTVNGRVDRRLKAMAEKLAAFSRMGEKDHL